LHRLHLPDRLRLELERLSLGQQRQQLPSGLRL
jgi:hypothetical protein